MPPALSRLVLSAHLKLLQRLGQVTALHQTARMQGRVPERGPYSEFLSTAFSVINSEGLKDNVFDSVFRDFDVS